MSHIVDLTIEQISSDSNKRKAEDELQQINHEVIDLTNVNSNDEEREYKNKEELKQRKKKIQKIQENLREEHINEDKKKYEESMNKKLTQVMKNCVQSLTFAKKMQIYNEAIKNRNHPWFINASHNVSGDGSWKYRHEKWCYCSSSNNDDYLQCIDEIVTVTLTK